MSLETKPTRINLPEPIKEYLHDIKTARHLIDNPEYFYQIPTPEQEEEFRKEYDARKSSAYRKGIRIPKTIDTFFGKKEIIRDELHFKNLLVKYILPKKHKPERITLLEGLDVERKKIFRKLNSLAPEEIKELQDKAAKTPFYVIDFKFKEKD